MKLNLVPLLEIQRELYDVPRGWRRFQRYLKTMMGGTDDIVLPLSVMNPMGQDHVAVTLDALIDLEAEAIAAAAVAAAERRLASVSAHFQIGLVVADDAQGGWTNRYFTETDHRFNNQGLIKRGWVTPLFWTSEEPSEDLVRAEVLMSVYRTAYVQHYGWPKTLRQMMLQEGLAAAFAGLRPLALDQDDLTYSREVIHPYLDSTRFPTIFACLYGDRAAKSVGYPALGLPPRAGYAIALDQVLQDKIEPEAVLQQS